MLAPHEIILSHDDKLSKKSFGTVKVTAEIKPNFMKRKCHFTKNLQILTVWAKLP